MLQNSIILLRCFYCPLGKDWNKCTWSPHLQQPFLWTLTRATTEWASSDRMNEAGHQTWKQHILVPLYDDSGLTGWDSHPPKPTTLTTWLQRPFSETITSQLYTICIQNNYPNSTNTELFPTSFISYILSVLFYYLVIKRDTVILCHRMSRVYVL